MNNSQSKVKTILFLDLALNVILVGIARIVFLLHLCRIVASVVYYRFFFFFFFFFF